MEITFIFSELIEWSNKHNGEGSERKEGSKEEQMEIEQMKNEGQGRKESMKTN